MLKVKIPYNLFFFPSIFTLQSEMGLATEQLSQQLLEYEKKVSSPEDCGLSPSFLSLYFNFLMAVSLDFFFCVHSVQNKIEI